MAAMACATAISLQAHPTDVDGSPFHDLEKLESLKSGDPLVDWKSARKWTSAQGQKIEAKVLALGAREGHFVMAGGRKAKIQLTRLSDADQMFLREWGAVSHFFDPGYTPPRSLSNTVKAEMFDGVFAKEGRSHETRNFRFECDVPLRAKLAKDFSKLFEVTHSAVAQLPLGLSLERTDGEKILVRLFSSKDEYIDAGGKRDAAGIYLIRERVVLVPLSSLGIEPTDNGTYRKTRQFDPATLIHETTHAVTHHWLPHMPLWFAEGLAEYVAALSYRDGVLDYSKHAAGIRARAAKKFGGDAERFELMAPAAFVHLGGSQFMGGRPVQERPVVLRAVKPFQIKLQNPGGQRPQVAQANVISARRIEPSIIKPPFAQPDPTVARRYVSSMLLVNHLLESDPAVVRKYLFSLLHGEWSRHRYLQEWEKTRALHHEAVLAQISAFDTKLQSFNSDVNAYNAAVKRHNAGEIVTIPREPQLPTPPKAIPVPAILAKPKSAKQLSRIEMRKRMLGKHLKLPDQVRLPSKN